MARMTAVEARVWVAFTNVVQGFLGTKKKATTKKLLMNFSLVYKGSGAEWASNCITYTVTWTSFQTTLEMSARNKARGFIKTLKSWKTGIKVVGTRIWCQITAGVWWGLIQMLYIRRRHQKENLPQTEMIYVSTNQTTLLLHIFWLDITLSVNVIYV